MFSRVLDDFLMRQFMQIQRGKMNLVLNSLTEQTSHFDLRLGKTKVRKNII